MYKIPKSLRAWDGIYSRYDVWSQVEWKHRFCSELCLHYELAPHLYTNDVEGEGSRGHVISSVHTS